MKKATFDPAQNLDLYFRVSRNGSKDFVFLKGGVAYDLSGISFEFRSGFDVTLGIIDNVITISIDESEVITQRSYFWELINLTTGKTWLCGTAYFTEENSAAVTDTENITIVEQGETVEVTINESGGTTVEHYKGGWDASGNTFPGDADTLASDFWRFTTGGTLDGQVWPAKTIAIALIDNPGQDPENWRIY